MITFFIWEPRMQDLSITSFDSRQRTVIKNSPSLPRGTLSNRLGSSLGIRMFQKYWSCGKSALSYMKAFEWFVARLKSEALLDVKSNLFLTCIILKYRRQLFWFKIENSSMLRLYGGSPKELATYSWRCSFCVCLYWIEKTLSLPL